MPLSDSSQNAPAATTAATTRPITIPDALDPPPFGAIPVSALALMSARWAFSCASSASARVASASLGSWISG